MISVQNHLRLLSGNRILLLFFSVLMLSSCGLFKSSTKTVSERKTPVKKEKQEKKEKEVEPIEPIEWIIVDDEVVFDDGKLEDDVKDAIPSDLLKSHYEISVLCPLYSSRSGLAQKNENVLRMVHFMQGMELASNRINIGEPTIKVNFIDIESKPSRLQQLLKENYFDNIDVIIGPYKTDDLALVVDYAKSENKIVISPWNTNQSISNDYSNYIQWKPGLSTHCEYQMQYISDNYRYENIIFISNNDTSEDGDALEMYFETTPFKMNFRDEKPLVWPYFKEIEEERGSSQRFKSILSTSKTNVIVMPFWNDLEKVNSFLTQLRTARNKNHDIVILGFPQWIDNEVVDFTFFHDFNILISYNYHIDENNDDVLQFKREFLDNYHTTPTTEAYRASDILQFLSYQLSKKGLYFTQEPQQLFDNNVFSPINLFRVIDKDTAVSDRFDTFNHLENKSIKMIRYDGASFQFEY